MTPAMRRDVSRLRGLSPHAPACRRSPGNEIAVDATHKAGQETAPADRAGQHDTPLELVVPEPDALLRSFSACVAAHEELRRSHAELQRRMAEFADDFAQVRAALRREQTEKARLEEEVRRLREAPADQAEIAARLREKE